MAEAERVVKITEAEFLDGKPTLKPHQPGADKSPTFFRVWVGSEDEGWREIPRVTNVKMDFACNDLRKAVITILLPEIEFTGGRS